MTDLSHKDKQYFIDAYVYNCPFCNRKNVCYTILDYGSFDFTSKKEAFYYLVKCNGDECGRVSFHLSWHNLEIERINQYHPPEWKFVFPPEEVISSFYEQGNPRPIPKTSIPILEDEKPKELDELFFYHQPTSAFTIDTRIPKEIRDPLNEADNCLKNNFLTGASACLRKAIYKLLQHQEISDVNIESSEKNYLTNKERIELLKKKYPKIGEELFDELQDVHILTSKELHDNDWVDFNGKHLKFLIAVTIATLREIYVLPDETNKRRKELAFLKSKVAQG